MPKISDQETEESVLSESVLREIERSVLKEVAISLRIIEQHKEKETPTINTVKFRKPDLVVTHEPEKKVEQNGNKRKNYFFKTVPEKRQAIENSSVYATLKQVKEDKGLKTTPDDHDNLKSPALLVW